MENLLSIVNITKFNLDISVHMQLPVLDSKSKCPRWSEDSGSSAITVMYISIHIAFLILGFRPGF